MYGFCGVLSRVLENIAVELEEPLGLQDLSIALQDLKGGKAPGIESSGRSWEWIFEWFL